MRSSVEKRVRVSIRKDTDICSLTSIGQDEAREGVAKPAQLNGMSTESADICKERFNASKCKKDATKTAPSMFLIANQIFKSIGGIESLQDRVVVLREIVNAEDSVEGQPDNDNGSEGVGNPVHLVNLKACSTWARLTCAGQAAVQERE